jgi:hypothetical protein
MIAGAGGDHAALALRFRQRQQLVERAAFFERSGALQIFKLEMERQTNKLGEVMREMAGRDVDRFADASSGYVDVRETDRVQSYLLEAKNRDKNEKATSRACGGWPGLQSIAISRPSGLIPARVGWGNSKRPVDRGDWVDQNVR